MTQKNFFTAAQVAELALGLIAYRVITTPHTDGLTVGRRTNMARREIPNNGGL